MIALDTDVLSIYYAFHGDARYEVTARFMEESKRLPRGVGIFNLLELCGIVASGGQPAEALRLFEEYQGADVKILYPPIVSGLGRDSGLIRMLNCWRESSEVCAWEMQ